MTASPTPTPSSVPANSSFPTTAPITTAAPKSTSTLTFAVGADQARYVATVVAFVDAFNAGAVDAALALLADNVVGSDCDYGRQTLITFQSKRDAEPWLRGRAAEHDRIEIAEIVNENPEPSTGSHVVAVGWASRRTDLLPTAIVPRYAAKVVFTPDGRRIIAFANGPTSCVP